MTNSQRQPKTEKAVGNPNKGAPASVIAQVEKAPNRFDSKPIDDGKRDES